MQETKSISGQDAIAKASIELKKYLEISDKKLYLEKLEPTKELWWIVMLGYYDISEDYERSPMKKALQSFAELSKQYVSIYLDSNGNFLKLKKANVPE